MHLNAAILISAEEKKKKKDDFARCILWLWLKGLKFAVHFCILTLQSLTKQHVKCPAKAHLKEKAYKKISLKYIATCTAHNLVLLFLLVIIFFFLPVFSG